jgi:hypothetical protein
MSQYVSGLDLGQSADHSALAVCRQVETTDPLASGRLCWCYECCHLARWPLGTPYTTVGEQVGIGEQVRDLFCDDPLCGSTLAVDQTGVGRAVVDMLRGLNLGCAVVGVTITGGELARQEALDWHVPKRALVSLLVSLLQSGRLRIAPALKLAPDLQRELAAFRVKQSASGHESFEAMRERDHDDLVCALGLSVWLGERQPPFRASDIGRGKQTRSRQAPLGTFLPPSMRPQRGRW